MKQMIIKTLGAAILWLLMIATVMGQTDESKTIRPRLGPHRQAIGFEFLDEKTGNVIGYFDIYKHNPFENYEFPVKDTSMYGTKMYDLSGLTNAEIRKRFNLPIPDQDLDMPVFGNAQTMWATTISGNYCAVSYQFYFAENGSGFLGVISTGFVIDDKGKIVFTIPKNFDAVRGIVLANDGKTLAIAAGDMSPESSYSFFTSEYLKIYDLKRKGKINKIGCPNAPYALGNKIVYSNHTSESIEYVIVDCPSLKTFTRTYTNGEFSGAKYYEDKGFIWKNEDGSVRKIHLWEKDFKVGKLK